MGGEKGLLQRWASEDPQPMRLQEGRAGLDGVNVMANISDGQERKERLTARLGQVWQGLKHVAGSGVTGSGRRDAEARTQDSDADDTVGGLGMVAAFALSDRLRERRLGVGGAAVAAESVCGPPQGSWRGGWHTGQSCAWRRSG